jgi:hypothetical protein|tara:strand:+ start:1291 stop:1620 length:330 start_codon:yes stop_codon:yes gene_type:complete
MKINGKCFQQSNLKTPAKILGYRKEGSYIYHVNKAERRKTKLKLIKVMEEKQRAKLANEFIVGYAKGFITDEECNEMIDLTSNKISSVDEDIKIECSADQDWEWYNESM